MYLLLRTPRVGDQGEAHAWTGSGWSSSPVHVLRMATPEAWRAYCVEHGLAGDIVRAEMTIHDHMGWTSGISPTTR